MFFFSWFQIENSRFYHLTDNHTAYIYINRMNSRIQIVKLCMGRSLVFFLKVWNNNKKVFACVNIFFFFNSQIHYVAVGECNNKKNGRHLLELKKKKKFFHGIHPFIYLSIYVVYNHEMNFFHFFTWFLIHDFSVYLIVDFSFPSITSFCRASFWFDFGSFLLFFG